MTTTDARRPVRVQGAAGRPLHACTASKGSYVQLQYGQLRPFEPGKPLEDPRRRKRSRRSTSRCRRGGVITGRILDEFGEPLADAQVAAQRYQNIGGRRRLMPAGRPAMTNDIGEFRLFAIPPGQYYLSATLRNMGGMMGDTDDRSGYAPTYFPGTSNMAEAQKVTIGLGQIVSDINMALTPTRTARITGTRRRLAGAADDGHRDGDAARRLDDDDVRRRPDRSSRTVRSRSAGWRQAPTCCRRRAADRRRRVGVDRDHASAATMSTASGWSAASRRPRPAASIVEPRRRGSLQPSALRVMAQPVVFDTPMMAAWPGPASSTTTSRSS